MNQEKLDKERIKEWKRNPMINLSDSVNRSMMGDPGAFLKNGCLTNLIGLIIIAIIFIFVSK